MEASGGPSFAMMVGKRTTSPKLTACVGRRDDTGPGTPVGAQGVTQGVLLNGESPKSAIVRGYVSAGTIPKFSPDEKLSCSHQVTAKKTTPVLWMPPDCNSKPGWTLETDHLWVSESDFRAVGQVPLPDSLLATAQHLRILAKAAALGTPQWNPAENQPFGMKIKTKRKKPTKLNMKKIMSVFY